MKKIVGILSTVVFFLFSFASLQAQNCDCYSVEGISLPQDTTGVLHLLLKNTCDDNVYLNSWVLADRDTIASAECWCGAILPLNQNVLWKLSTKLRALPPLHTLRVVISNRTLDCQEVRFADGLSDGGLPELPGDILLPQPVHTSLFIKSSNVFTTADIYDTRGKLIAAARALQANTLDVSDIAVGVYYLYLETQANKKYYARIVRTEK